MDFFKGIGDFFGGLFGKKKKQNEVNSLQQPSQPRPQPNTLSSQADLGSTKFNPSTNFESKPDYSFKTTALTPSTKPVNDATDFSKDNTSGLKLDLNSRFKPNGNKFTLGGSSRIENTAVHEDDINNTIKQINDRYHNERDSLGRFWGSFTGDTDRRDKELRRKILTDEMKKITDGLGSNPDGSYKRDYTDDEAYKMATLQLAMRHGIDSRPLKAFVPAGSIDKKPIDSNTMGEWSLATARTIKNMTDGEDGIGGLVGNALLGKRKTDEGFNLGRFIADLPAGMVAGGAGIGSGISDALSGKRMLDDGTIQDLNGLQRFGSGLDAAISAFGLPSGASGKLLSSIFKRGAKQAAAETTKTGLKEAAKRITKELAKGAASEGLEEGVQQIAQNLSDTNNYDNNGNFKIENLLNQVPESAALGALGGGIMGGASLGINAGKSKLNELSQNIRQDIDQRINPQTNPVQNAVAKIEANNSLKYSLSQNQENFFKDSKIRDANGDLMPVYHGTNQDFNQFEDSKIQKADLGRGFYFTDNKDIAKNYADIRANERGGKGKVMETFLNVKNPFDLNYQPREAALDYLTYYFANNGQTNTQASNSAKTLLDMSIADGDIVDGDYSSVFNTKEPEFEKWAKSKGYDGIVVPGGDQDSGLSGNAYVVFEPNQIKSAENLNPTDNPDIRYKNDTTQDIQSFSEQNLRKIIGNEYDIVSKASDNTPRTAQGYADLKNGIVSILDGKMSTANHEATHIAINALTDVNPKLANSALNSIINSYGADTLISEANKSGYGDILGHKLDVANIDDVRYAAEERLANDFAKYAEAKAKGRENYYAKKNSIPAQIKAWFDRVIDHLKDMASRLDSAHNFMYKLERGDFANMIDNHVNSMRGQEIYGLDTKSQMAYRIDPETNIVHIDNNIIEGVPKSQILNTIKKYIQKNLQGQSYSLNYGNDGEAKINARTTRKMVQPDNNLPNRGELIGDLPDILKVSQKINEAADTKNHSFARDGFEYRKATVEVNGKLYDVKINIGLDNDNKLLYTINGIKESSLVKPNSLSRWELYGDNVSQSSPDVKMKLENTNTDHFGNRFSEQEIPVSQLRRSQEFQPRTTASGKGTSDSVFKHGYNEGMVDQPMLVRKNSDGTYEVLGGHSRTEGLERRARAGLENPETVKARVYDNLTDKQALQVSQAANQGGQYESILDMAKSISDARNAGIEPSVQRQNMVKGYSMDDYDALYKILSNDRNLQGLVFEGAISQEDMLSIARTSRKLNFEPARTQNLVREAYSRGDFNRKGVESVMKALSTKEHNKEYNESLNGFSFMDDMEALDSQQEILDAQKAIKKQALLDNSLDRVINNFDSFSSDQQAKILEMINNEKLNNSDSVSHEDKNTTIEPVMDNQKSDLQTEVNRTDTEQEETPRQDATDNEVENYVKDQVENQKKSTSGGLMQKIKDVKDFLRHHLNDDSTAYEQYLAKGHDKESKLAREKLKEDIRNDIDKVRSSDMIAQQFIRDNGLAELGKMSTKDLNQFQQYLIARRHAADLHKQGINTGRDLDMDLAIIDKYKKKFTEQEKIYRNFNKQLLNYMEDNGLISKELHNKLNQNTAYTPYQRLMDDVSSFTGHSQQLGNLNSEQVIKKMKGSDRTILNPIEATMSNTMRIINEGQRNVAARKIAENAFSENRLKDGQKPRAGFDTLNFMENGKKVSYEVPKMVASEMKRLNRVLPEGVEKVISALSMPAKTLRGGATSLNPIFAASNLIRDQLQTTITGNIGANIKGTPKALLATFGFGEKADNLRAELSRQGIIGSEYRQTYGYKQGDLMAELQKEHHLSKKAADRLKHPIDALNDLIGRTEYFTRAQQYFGTDGDITAKSQAARNNTLNFSRGGEAIMVINRAVPFLNAGIQGGIQITRQLVKRPARTALALAAWAGIAMAAKGISESDEKKKELYDRVSDYEKKTNLVLFDKDAKYNPETGRIDGLVKIPIPQFLYPITDSMNNIKDSPDALLKTASNIFEVFTGLDTENPVNQLTPTAIKPFIEAATNTNTFTKQDIVSDYDKNKLPQDKGAKYTTGAARFLSSLTGVDAPVIDNFIANWSGGLGKDLAKTLTDNPDNQKDGGGIGRIFTEGAYRRFGSAGADSQYKMAVDSGEKLKKQLESYSDFKNLSKEDQEKVKNAIDSDFKQIGSTFGKLERGDEVKNKLSDRQTGLLQGFNSGKYIEEALKGTRQVNKDRLNSENDYEYNEFKKEYEEKSAKGEYSRKSRIDAQNKLKRLEVGKDFTKETRDLYGLGKDDLRNLIESSEDGNKVLDNVIAYGDALVRAGVTSRNKFRDRYGNVSLSGTSRSGRSGGPRSRGGTPSYKMDTMSLIRGALKSSSRGKTSVSFNRKAATKANTRAIKRLNSSKIKR
jgi:hypothetical protein|nr:MAG TPA: ParB-like nuclease domain [Caudoviricetes sp.]